MKRLVIVLATAGATLAGTAFAANWFTGEQTPVARPLPAAATATVRQGDLVSQVTVAGTLGYLQHRDLSTAVGGVVTWVPKEGAVVKRAGRLFAVDGEPTMLLYGNVPAYRKLVPGDEGQDVRQLEQNLEALGYADHISVDDTYTSGTATAVRHWQDHHHLPETGTLELGQAAFAPGPVRVQTAHLRIGDATGAGGKALTVTGQGRGVSLEVKVPDAAKAKPGTKVKIELPDGTVLDGVVATVGASATIPEDQDDSTPRVPVTVAVSDTREVLAIDKSPATVRFPGQTRKNVFSVPVGALIVLPGGSFGVQVTGPGPARDVVVTLGMFAQGQVEVSGVGLAAGEHVTVATT